MQIVDLFSGIGGFSLAGKWAGWETVQFVEINPFCRKVLEYRFPNVPVFDDIKKFNINELKKSKWNPSEDTVVCSGFPCQPFSSAGRRKGAADDRYLWPEVIRLVREIKPVWFIGENVAGITSMVQPGSEVEVERGKTLFGEDYSETVSREEYIIERILNDLEQAGYSVRPLIIPACAVGAPHRRDRIWIIAYRADAGTEGLQQEGENGVCEPPAVTHPDSDDATRYGHAETGGENGKNESKGTVAGNGFSFDLSDKGIVAHANDKLQERRLCNREENGFESFYSSNIPPRAAGGGRRQNDKSKPSGQSEQNIPNWRNFPTQSPVCWGDDGLSSRLVGITFSAWRRQAIEAFGNAIVPQVAYEIFKIIDKL
jgi:DNA (cytosine-5)-methyltransferase 1